jgi:maltooligosyltrehalose trehalohydrolase
MTKLPLGSKFIGDQRTSFALWAPAAERVQLRLHAGEGRVIPMEKSSFGYHQVVANLVEPGAEYTYLLGDGLERPDPVSRWQPKGVHGPSAVADPNFPWQDQSWFGLPLCDYIIYELHVGTFTAEGTFESLIPELPYLKNLGVTALELMPVAEFPGRRNWGYDGVYPFAAQSTYGGPTGLKRLVNACHKAGLAIILDVVYNHLGPEGNYLNDFGPYFTDRYQTAWGRGLNFDGPYSDEVRRFFLENALYWQTEFHLDALRLDAVHAIRDASASPFLLELARATRDRAKELNRRFHLIAESDLNNTRYILPELLNGLGLDAQWSDDFHHSLHVLLTGEQDGYYEDFGGVKPLAKVFQQGYFYTGQYSKHRRHRHGNSPWLNGSKQFIVYSQNHDQIGNRKAGDRLAATLDLERLKLAAGTVILSPFIPLLFMGEEYGDPAPFQYFISHSDPELVEAVRHGRREEFAVFGWKGQVPDPQSEETFIQCRAKRKLAGERHHRVLFNFYRELIRLRQSVPAIRHADKRTLRVQTFEREKMLAVEYAYEQDLALLLCSFSVEPGHARCELEPGSWQKILDSSASLWSGPGPSTPDQLVSTGGVDLSLKPASLVLYRKQQES